MEKAIERGLEAIGLTAEGHAKKNTPVDTGRLRNSIGHAVEDKAAYIGSNVEYAPYVELGTGKHYSGGRPDPWVYQDDNGRWHHTNGQRARPYLKPAVADHKRTYENIFKDELKNG
jgi:HK97 gp10 family phage protein